jgi:methionyl-tRNA formyltransferase
MNISKKIVFFGTEDFSLHALTGLVDAGYNVVAVVTKPDSLRGRHQVLTAPVVKEYALSNGIVVWQPKKLTDITADIVALGDVAGVLVSYGKIIPQSIIDLFQPGIINVHPSFLPLYRGPAPIEAAIIHGDRQLGISIMQLTAGMDEGPVYGYTEVDLNGTETQQSLLEIVADEGTKTLLQLLPGILDGTISPLTQDDNKATYTKLLSKDDALLQTAQLSAADAERKVRAHLSFPKTKINVLGHDIIITKAHVSHTQNTPLDVLCQDGAFLSIDELVAPSGKTMKAEAFLRGYTAG